MPCPPISLSYQLLFGESPPHPTVDRGRHVSMFPYPDGLRVVGESCHVDDLGGVVHHGVDPGDLEEESAEKFQFDLLFCEKSNFERRRQRGQVNL